MVHSPACDTGVRNAGWSLAGHMRHAAALVRTIEQHRLSHSQNDQNDEDQNQNIKTQDAVHLRVRPLSDSEVAAGLFPVVHCARDRSTLYYPSYRLLSDASLDVHAAHFDGNHSIAASNDHVCASALAGIVDFAASSAGIAAVFAYGQTGAGKTHTMSAVAARTARDLPYASHAVSISALEVHGDAVLDLLARTHAPAAVRSNTTNVRVFNDSLGRVVVLGASDVPVASETESIDTINRCFAVRTTRSTAKNDSSSRTHLICRIRLTKRPFNKTVSDPAASAIETSTSTTRDINDDAIAPYGEIRLIDLAGSERHSDTKTHDAERLKEAALINSSLMALKECIRKRSRALTTTASSSHHLPFRNSKLTMLLKDALDPKNKQPTRIVMIACVAPTVADVSHSLNTFRYASALKTSQGDDATDHDGYLKPTTASSLSSSLYQAKSTPMAWSISKLEHWINAKSTERVSLAQLLGTDGDSRLSRSGVFVPPPWKFLYDLPAQEWVKRSVPGVSAEEALALRIKYRALFVQARAVAPSDAGVSSGPVQSIMVDEGLPSAAEIAAKTRMPGSKGSSSISTRQALAMERLKARGEAARNKVAAANANATGNPVLMLPVSKPPPSTLPVSARITRNNAANCPPHKTSPVNSK